MIEVRYQAWKNGYLIHPYRPFDREKALKNGETAAVARYDYCLRDFMKLSEEERRYGLIYGGIEFDFSLEEVD